MPPAYFALVMATGIIATASNQQGIDWLAEALYALAAAAFVILLVLLVLRIILYRDYFLADLTNHAKGFGYLTLVAGMNVLAAASVLIHGWWDIAEVLWWASLPLFVVLGYSALISDILRSEKPNLGAGINGSWFLLAVSVESIAATGAVLVPEMRSDFHAFVCIAAFGLGLVLYLIVMTMLFLRWTFQPLEPTEADPPAWIAAGAVAITVLAGSNLLLVRDLAPRIHRLGEVIEGVVTMAWATSTFWFPVMIAIGVWRHIVRRVPLRYLPSYWSLVFPLGMYSASTNRMRKAIGLAHIGWLPKLVLVVAFVAWTATFVGLAAQGWSATKRRRLARNG
ncbi:MAG: tellurite resistance/C4-dicarboxylate transporter family protein [Acidimicrobiales bacterium]|nr:tellurite resistance/C4-dicarboxylate transporter family protein [Acidimicrobiales bacterium]